MWFLTMSHVVLGVPIEKLQFPTDGRLAKFKLQLKAYSQKRKDLETFRAKVEQWNNIRKLVPKLRSEIHNLKIEHANAQGHMRRRLEEIFDRQYMLEYRREADETQAQVSAIVSRRSRGLVRIDLQNIRALLPQAERAK